MIERQAQDDDMRRFPSDELLADYASGSLPGGMSLLVASHLTFCPESRRRVRDLESVGGAMMASEPKPDVAPPGLDAVLARLGEAPDPAPEPARRDEAGATVFPAPLRDALGMTEGEVPWRFRLPGLSEYDMDGYEGEEVGLLRAKPGAPIFSHTHSGVEATLVLCGAMEDRGQVFRRGEVTLATEHDDHRPRIVGDEVCICLVVMTGELRFTGRFSRALNLIAE
jgi:putative transcriptional regulator